MGVLGKTENNAVENPIMDIEVHKECLKKCRLSAKNGSIWKCIQNVVTNSIFIGVQLNSQLEAVCLFPCICNCPDLFSQPQFVYFRAFTVS